MDYKIISFYSRYFAFLMNVFGTISNSLHVLFFVVIRHQLFGFFNVTKVLITRNIRKSSTYASIFFYYFVVEPD